MLISYQKQRNIYLVLLSGTVLILIAMFIADVAIEGAMRDKGHVKTLQQKAASGERINDMLISADELTIEEKTAFINLYLKQNNPQPGNTNEDIRQQRTEVYSKIFRRKANQARTVNSDEDFYIKEIPK